MVAQSSFCASMEEYTKVSRRKIYIVNLDPAAEEFTYDVAFGKFPSAFPSLRPREANHVRTHNNDKQTYGN